MDLTKKFHSILATFGLVLFLTPAAQAVSFDFVAAAAGNEHGGSSLLFSSGLVSITASGRNIAGSASYNAYLDDLDGALNPGGLGVCKSLNGSNHCNPSNDDNLTADEVLTLTFNSQVTIQSLTFNNGIHLDNYLGNFGVVIDSFADSVGDFTQYAAVPIFSVPLTGTVFSFISDASISGQTVVERQLYLSGLTATAVPEPATAAFLGFGLIPVLRRIRAKHS